MDYLQQDSQVNEATWAGKKHMEELYWCDTYIRTSYYSMLVRINTFKLILTHTYMCNILICLLKICNDHILIITAL